MSPVEKDLLHSLIRIPSVNPSLANEGSSLTGEAKVTEFLTLFCEERNWAWIRQVVHPGRDNLVAQVPGRAELAKAPPMLWEVHQDTVAVEGMTIEPFSGDSKAGRIWGRGACDVKGGMAALLAAAQRLEETAEPHPPILLAFTVNEECGFTGVKALARIWDPTIKDAELGEFDGPLELSALRAARPKCAIVAEPTSLNVVVAHQGIARWRCHAKGRAAHTSRPDEGDNAIYGMAELAREGERNVSCAWRHVDD